MFFLDAPLIEVDETAPSVEAYLLAEEAGGGEETGREVTESDPERDFLMAALLLQPGPASSTGPLLMEREDEFAFASSNASSTAVSSSG